MSLRGFTINNGVKSLSSYDFTSVPTVKYDDVVDRSQFRPDSEQVRNFGLTGSGSNGQGAYDNDNIPSDDVVRVRSGKLDRTEVAKLLEQSVNNGVKQTNELEKRKVEKAKQDLIDARQDYLDKATGFKGSPQSV